MTPSASAAERPKIACLAWGSLVWKIGPLRLKSGWRFDGPLLPIEFARVGDHGELATVLWDAATAVPTCWALVDADTLAHAHEMLRQREEIPPARPEAVGQLVASCSSGIRHESQIARWAVAQGMDAVVWTALPPRFAGEEGRAPSVEEAIAYLSRLQGPTRDHALNYLRRVPAQIETPYRAALRDALGG